MSITWLRQGTLLIVLIVCSFGRAAAQPTYSLSGTVKDTTGGVLSDAEVTITGGTLTVPRTALTNEFGRYEIPALAPGRYTLSVVRNNFDSITSLVDVAVPSTTHDVVMSLAGQADNITVTATKTGMSDIQLTPAAITAIPTKALEELGARSFADLHGLIPSVTFSPLNYQTQIRIRGIGTTSSAAGSDQSSSVYLDGVYLGRPAMAFMNFLDVERVEVLRGPQVILYGRNSVGGTVNVVTRQPTNHLTSTLRAEVGNYSQLRIEGAVSGPLVRNKVMGSVAVARSRRDGFVTDLEHPDDCLGSDDSWAGRGQLRMVFNPTSELLVSTDHATFNGTPLFYAKALHPRPGFSAPPLPDDPWQVRASHIAQGDSEQSGVSARASIQFDAATTLSSLTAYRRSRFHAFFDPDATEQIRATTDVADYHRQWSEELTVVRRTPTLQSIAGVFVYDDDNEGPVALVNYLMNSETRPYSRIGARAWALFGQASYGLSRELSLSAGLRYSHETKDAHNVGGVYRPGTDMLVNPNSFYDWTDEATFSAWTPSVTMQWHASPIASLYVSAARGFKSGGFNPTDSDPERSRYRPELVWSYEAGLKHAARNGRIRLNAAGFYSDYSDLQVQTLIQQGLFFVSTGAATIKGVEVEISATPRAPLRVTGMLSWMDARFDRYITKTGPTGPEVDLAGNRLTHVPNWSGGASLTYRLGLAGRGTLSFRGDATWQTDVFYSAFNDPLERQGAYGLLRFRSAFEPPSSRWELALFMHNVGNQSYVTGTNVVGLATVISARPGEPRRWGTQLTIRY